MSEYYKVEITCESLEEDDEGDINNTGNVWEEGPGNHFKSIEEAQNYINDMYEIQKGELNEDNNSYTLWRDETEDGKKYQTEVIIMIIKYNTKVCKFEVIKDGITKR